MNFVWNFYIPDHWLPGKVGKCRAGMDVSPFLQVAGGKDESVMEPLWTPSGELIFISDRSGFWNLYSEQDGHPKALLPMQAECGSPAWTFGNRSYQILPDGGYGCSAMSLMSEIPASLNINKDT